jgi:D-alanyl-D-alanine carboxypeptidase/D-alanyl-D-alanine-endopeptidase (penicillin-binding protein 4)
MCNRKRKIANSKIKPGFLLPALKLTLWAGLSFSWLAIGIPLLAVADSKLPASVQSVLNVRKIADDKLSIFVTDLGTGKSILEWNPDTPRNPASTMKLVATLVALDELGPSYEWKTEIYALGEIVDGRLKGDLLIKGYGDPFLVTERVWRMVRDLTQSGLTEIDGDLVLDDSYFKVEPYDPGAFDRQPLRAYNVAPNALLMNLKVVRYWFEPDASANSVRVVIEPPLENLRVENRLALANSGCTGYQRGISITAADSFTTMILDGKFPSRCKSYALSRTALDHNAYAYGLFSSMWKEAGNRFDGSWRTGLAPENQKPLISFPSRPLSEIISLVNKHSNNVMARQLLYTLAAEAFGPPATEQGGREVVAAWFERNLPEVDSLVLVNGAGLSREARIDARDFDQLLRFAWSQTYMPEFIASLALSGHDGTVSRRFDDINLIGRAHLKTGSLDDVSAIAGYMQAKSGRRFALVAMLNDKDAHRGLGEEVQTALLRYLNDL